MSVNAEVGNLIPVCNRLDNQVDEVGKNVHELIERLGAVMKPAEPSCCDNAKPEGKPVSPTVERLEGCIQRLGDVVLNLEDCMKRLDI